MTTKRGKASIILMNRFGASTEDEAVRHRILGAGTHLAFALRRPDWPLKRHSPRQGRGIFPIIGALVIAGSYLPLTLDRARATGRTVDLELVLAADVSGSMDLKEAILQRQGFVRAFRHRDVIEAIQRGRLGRIAVTYVEWSGVPYQRTLVDWTEIADVNSAAAFARAIEPPSVMIEGYTSIGTLIAFAVQSFDGNGFQGDRRVIDISGDGPNNQGTHVVRARDRAVADGITINGLPIINDRAGKYGFPPMPDLDLYYEDCVIGGEGAFIVVASGFADFARAVRRKLVLEIAGRAPPLRLMRLAADKPRPPCDAGEIQLRNWRPPVLYDF